MSELRQAAQAVVDRWDTPLWKDAPHTAEFIHRLRAALAAPPMSDETCARNEGAKDVPVMYDMDCAPLDGTLVQLLVRFDHNGIEDTNEPTWTIGSHNDGEWNFVGWCWHTDEWARGSGDIIGWLPFKAGIQPVDHQRSGQAASGSQENARSDVQNGVGQPEAPTAAPLYVACHECTECRHIGINDESATESACSLCRWHGPSPDEDVCPECNEKGTMCSACPKCGGYYTTVAEAHIAQPPARSGAGSEEAQPDRSEES